MLSKVRLFGLELTVAADGTIGQPSLTHLRVKHWGDNRVLGDSEAVFNAWIEVADAHTIQFSLRLKLDAVNGVGLPATTPQLPHPPSIFRLLDQTFSGVPSGAALAIRSGGIR